jgi:hypothetical protein
VYLLILVGRGIGPAILAPVRLAVSTIFFGRLIKELVIKRSQSNSDFLALHALLAYLSSNRFCVFLLQILKSFQALSKPPRDNRTPFLKVIDS